MIPSGRNTDDKMIKLLWKNPDNFLLFLGPHTCLHFMLHALQSILSELYIPPLFYVKHSIFAESRYPLFIRSITTPPNHNFLNKRPKGPHIVHLSTMCHLFEESAKVDICLLISPKNTNLVEDFEILLPVKFC